MDKLYKALCSIIRPAILLGIMGSYANAQNMTDLAVINDRSADRRILQSDFSTVDEMVFAYPDRIRFDDRCFSIDGKDIFIFSGTVHYFRIPKELWKDRLEKIRNAGFNCVETYVPWNRHEPNEPKSLTDYSQMDLTEFEEFLALCHDMGFYTIVRPGPYICAEWSGGGFPQWIMNKRPTRTKHEVWLQSDDEEFVRWSKHWYDAVCRAVAPHQVFNREPGTGGTILFQVENEFNRVKWVPSAGKKAYLERLTEIARDGEIEVPVITCWTSEARNVESGPLDGVVDMVNSYPRWQIEKNFGRLINQQLMSQPGKPLLSGELQGGWYGDVNGMPSWEQDGIAGVQTQNITLYALQRGFCGLNYYMLAGGSNFDDTAARGVTTSYDFAAAIGENGTVNERYYRLQSLAPFLKEHGPAIARAKEYYPADAVADTLVSVCLRVASSGDRYYFVRTEDHTKGHFGIVHTPDATFDYVLEPFGSMVYYIPDGEKEGEWFPKQMRPESRPYVDTPRIKLEKNARFSDVLPKKWTKLKKGETVDRKGINGRHFIYYRTTAKEGHELEISRPGKGLVNGTDADTLLLLAGNHILFPTRESKESAFYILPGDSLSGKPMETIILYESKGLHHHTNKSVEENWHIGPGRVVCAGKELTLEYAYTEYDRGIQLSDAGLPVSAPGCAGNKSIPKDVDIAGDGHGRGRAEDSLMVWNVYDFDLPDMPAGMSYPHMLRLRTAGNGFIYLNGHPLGRCWQGGSQTEYYLPESWLCRGGKNRIAISLRPSLLGARVEDIDILALTEGASYKNE